MNNKTNLGPFLNSCSSYSLLPPRPSFQVPRGSRLFAQPSSPADLCSHPTLLRLLILLYLHSSSSSSSLQKIHPWIAYNQIKFGFFEETCYLSCKPLPKELFPLEEAGPQKCLVFYVDGSPLVTGGGIDCS